MKTECEICPHHCQLDAGQTGICRGRINLNGKITAKNYGVITSCALDPIEKKPLYRFYPSSLILSVGSYGCNLHCPFCQNHEISMDDGSAFGESLVPPELLVARAKELKNQGNLGIAYTYNEPLISYEYVYDCARLAAEHDLKNVLVTNGMICAQPLQKLLPWIDAMNIDLKGSTSSFYTKIGGDLDTVKQTIDLAAPLCHIELSTLIIPGENDDEAEIEELSAWVASINPEIPLHLTRFFPRWQMTDKEPTPVETLHRLKEIACQHLKYVYVGNC